MTSYVHRIFYVLCTLWMIFKCTVQVCRRDFEQQPWIVWMSCAFIWTLHSINYCVRITNESTDPQRAQEHLEGERFLIMNEVNLDHLMASRRLIEELRNVT